MRHHHHYHGYLLLTTFTTPTAAIYYYNIHPPLPLLLLPTSFDSTVLLPQLQYCHHTFTTRSFTLSNIHVSAHTRLVLCCVMSSHCSPSVLPLLSLCSPTALPLFSHCSPTALTTDTPGYMLIAFSAYTSFSLSNLFAFSFSPLAYSRQRPPSPMTYVCAPHPALNSQLMEVALLAPLVQEAWEEAPSDLEEAPSDLEEGPLGLEEGPSVLRLAQEQVLEEAAALHRLSAAVSHLLAALAARLLVDLEEAEREAEHLRDHAVSRRRRAVLRAGLHRAVAHHAAEHHAAQALQGASCSSCPIQLSGPPAVLLLATSVDPEAGQVAHPVPQEDG